jgi:RNA polymerase sigma factor (sigma-70 family)
MTQVSTTVVRRAMAGDDRAWEELVDQYGGLLRVVGRDFRLAQEQAADAAQTTWMRLVQDFEKIRDLDKLGGWLATTMRRECIRLVNRQRGEVLTDDWTGARFAHNTSADVAVLLAERNAILWSAVKRLPPRQREVMLALAAEPPPSYDEVAAELSMPIGAIGPTRQRALRRLRRLLVEAGMVQGGATASTVERPEAPPLVADAATRGERHARTNALARRACLLTAVPGEGDLPC